MCQNLNIKFGCQNVKPKDVGAFIVYFRVNFNILKQINCALVGIIKD
jgi:hypothetical protein